jgi:hypothetical protein
VSRLTSFGRHITAPSLRHVDVLYRAHRLGGTGCHGHTVASTQGVRGEHRGQEQGDHNHRGRGGEEAEQGTVWGYADAERQEGVEEHGTGAPCR